LADPVPQRGPETVDRFLAGEELVLELDDTPLELGDPFGVRLGCECGAGDRGELLSDRAAEVFAEFALEDLDDLVLPAELRGVVGDLDSQLRGGRVACRDRLCGLLVLGRSELLADAFLEIGVLGVVDELHAHPGPAGKGGPVKRDALHDHAVRCTEHRRALLLRDQPVMLGQVIRHLTPPDRTRG
jgi:hypothetical protein